MTTHQSAHTTHKKAALRRQEGRKGEFNECEHAIYKFIPFRPDAMCVRSDPGVCVCVCCPSVFGLNTFMRRRMEVVDCAVCRFARNRKEVMWSTRVYLRYMNKPYTNDRHYSRHFHTRNQHTHTHRKQFALNTQLLFTDDYYSHDMLCLLLWYIFIHTNGIRVSGQMRGIFVVYFTNVYFRVSTIFHSLKFWLSTHHTHRRHITSSSSTNGRRRRRLHSSTSLLSWLTLSDMSDLHIVGGWIYGCTHVQLAACCV